MSAAKHTRGPWKAVSNENDLHKNYVIAGNQPVAWCNTNSGNDEANAKLMASAPQLLELLEGIPAEAVARCSALRRSQKSQ